MHASWTAEAAAILQRSHEYYGGLATWRALRCIRLFPRELTGMLPRLKGIGRTFPVPGVMETWPHEQRTVFHDYPLPGERAVFDAAMFRHRATFRGLAKYRRWSPADALYFFGYAIWHYHAVPFTLGDARLLAATRRAGNDDVLVVEFPAELPTHSRRQAFHVGADGRIVRHDYTAEVIGPWARGAHCWNAQTRISGLPVAMERRVTARLGSLATPLTVLRARFSGAEIELAQRAAGPGSNER